MPGIGDHNLAASTTPRARCTPSARVVAVVRLQPGAEATEEELVEFPRGRLARYRYPREVRIVAGVPLTSVGKTDRKAVRAMVREGAQ